MSENKNEIVTGDHTRAYIELYTVDGTGTPQKMFKPVLLDNISWYSEWACTPSKMTFTVLKDGVINFGMGTKAVLKINDDVEWSGYVMHKHRTKDVKIECTAYDNLRYLKVKLYQSFENVQSAADPVKKILDMLELPVGEIDELKQATQGDVVFDGKEALEVIEELIGAHAALSLENLVFFDKAGKIYLKKLDNMRVTNQFFTAGEMEDWDYTTSIEDSYNSIMIDVLQSDGETHDRFVTVEDEGNINRWGLLRYVAQSNEEIEAIESKAKVLLELLNREVRTLKLTKVVGNPQIRGGSMIAVKLNLGDMLLYSWMVVKEVTHTIGQDGYWMDMTVTNENLGFADPVSPDGAFTVTKPTSDASSATSVGGTGTYEERMYNTLRANGFSAQSACGVLANAWAESGVEPTKQQIGGNAYGLFQWDDRKTKLMSWCQSGGYDYTSFEGQMAYFFYEFNGGDSTWISYANANCAGTSGFKNLISLESATTIFLRGFERAGVERLQERINKAHEYYDKWGQYTTIPGTSGSANGDGKYTGRMGWPFAGGGGTITQNFSWNGKSGHLGMDISTRSGTGAGSPVLAVDGGTVASAGWAVSHSSYGNEVNIKHKDGLYTRYAHLSAINVSAGQSVSKGQQIGVEGNTGNSYGTHLHLEVHAGIPNGQRYDPAGYLHRNG